MDQLERIQYMEAILDRMETVLSALHQALNDYQELLPRIGELERYYSSSLWQQDYQADEAGLLPPELKRGILSEDGIWNSLADRDGLRVLMQQLGSHETGAGR